MRDATLCFLIKEKEGEIAEVCLAMKKRGFGVGRWNGVGGKVGDKNKETIEEALIRETQEEIGVALSKFHKVAELTFIFAPNKDWNQVVHTYFATEWEGEPQESEEMKPQWFAAAEIPFTSMWPDDIHWLPKVLEQNFVKAAFVFGKDDIILKKKLSAKKIIKRTSLKDSKERRGNEPSEKLRRRGGKKGRGATRGGLDKI